MPVRDDTLIRPAGEGTGIEIEIGSGLSADDRIIVAPPDGIADGDQVRIAGRPGTNKPARISEKQDGKG